MASIAAGSQVAPGRAIGIAIAYVLPEKLVMAASEASAAVNAGTGPGPSFTVICMCRFVQGLMSLSGRQSSG